MTNNAFVDVLLVGTTSPRAAIMAAVVRHLHPWVGQADGAVALAWPRMKMGDRPTMGPLLRIFADSEDRLHEGLTLLGELKAVMGEIEVGNIQSVPPSWEGAWVEYRRVQIPSRRGKSMVPAHQEERAEKRARRLAYTDTCPFVNMQSLSSAQAFRLFVEEVAHDINPGESHKASSYGLSRRFEPVYLPRM